MAGETQHPGLRSVLEALHKGDPVTEADVGRLQRQLEYLEARAQPERRQPQRTDPPAPLVGTMLPGHASREGTDRFAAELGTGSVDFYRPAQDLLASSLGIGTYRGAMDAATDAAYTAAVHAALRAGINVIDTSLNYRHQRAERSVAAGIRRFVDDGDGGGDDDGGRDGIVVCTKGGFLVPGAVTPGTLTARDVVDGCHAIAPAFVADQIERSRQNLGLETIDVYYLHNPEVQLGSVGATEFTSRMRRAFEGLEAAVADGRIRYYGTATWNGYLDGSLSLPSLVAAARDVAGDGHHFRFAQLPVNLSLREELASSAGGDGHVLAIAAELGVTVVASASLLQGRLAQDLPDELATALPGLRTDAERAIQFTRSTPGITTALVGMRDSAHVRENAAVAKVSPLTPTEYRRNLQRSRAPRS